jgi:hypothetical protein
MACCAWFLQTITLQVERIPQAVLHHYRKRNFPFVEPDIAEREDPPDSSGFHCKKRW